MTLILKYRQYFYSHVDFLGGLGFWFFFFLTKEKMFLEKNNFQLKNSQAHRTNWIKVWESD